MHSFASNQNTSIVKLGDFGVSRKLEGTLHSRTRNASGVGVGTPYTMSPEACESRPLSAKSDLWSLGCVLYEACEQRNAFEAENLVALSNKIINAPTPSISDAYSVGLQALVQDMLQKEPAQRPSIDAILGRLSELPSQSRDVPSLSAQGPLVGVPAISNVHRQRSMQTDDCV